MDVVYINLDREVARREALEANFRAHNTLGWNLVRLPALDGHALSDDAGGGQLTPAEAGCFASHARAIEQSLGRPGPTMIIEDDTEFGASSQRLITDSLRSLPSWDVVYTDVSVFNVQTMVELFALRRKRRARPALLPLRNLSYIGTTAYIVNEPAKLRLLQYLADLTKYPHHVAFDVWLRYRVMEGAVAAYVTFPFTTTLSDHAEHSQVQPVETMHTNAIFNAYRRLMWCDADVPAVADSLASVDFAALAPDEVAFLKMLALVIQTASMPVQNADGIAATASDKR